MIFGVDAGVINLFIHILMYSYIHKLIYVYIHIFIYLDIHLNAPRIPPGQAGLRDSFCYGWMVVWSGDR